MSWHQETSCRQSKKITLLFLFCYFEAAFISGSCQKRRRIKVKAACPSVGVTSCGQLSINFVLTPDRKVKGKKYCDFSWVSLLAARVSSLCVRDNSHWQIPVKCGHFKNWASSSIESLWPCVNDVGRFLMEGWHASGIVKTTKI